MQNRHLVQSRKQQSNMKPIIYCDMDGVLADFKTAAQRTTGMSINKWMNIPSSKEKWAPIPSKYKRGVLAKYEKLVSSASIGAITDE